MNIKDETAVKLEKPTDEMAVKEIEVGTSAFDYLLSEPSARGLQYRKSTLDYDALAVAYNNTKAGNLLMVALPNRPSPSNLRKTLADRALTAHDYRLIRPTVDEQGRRYPKTNRPLVLQRLSDKQMRIILKFATAVAENMAKEAAQRGSSYDFAQSEIP